MKHNPTSDDLLSCAVAAARAAGCHALHNASLRLEAISRPAHDIKLRLDIESQQKAEHVIRSTFPEHMILGEEDVAPDRSRASSRFQWIIDPIDGTVNFSHGFPIWCSSVAISVDDEAVAGAVYAPELDKLYTASIDQVAQCNGREIHVSPVDSLESAMVFTGLDKSIDPKLPPFEVFRRLSANIQKARIIGSAALDICHVAEGHAEGYFESGIYLWDVAAAGLIVRRAGGKAEILCRQKNHRLQFIASNGLVHEALKSLVQGRPADAEG